MRSVSLVGALLWGGLLVACGGEASDVGSDSGVDVGGDAEAESPDGDSDGPQWVPLAQIDGGCSVDRLLRPSTWTYGQRSWVPCTEPIEGCRRLDFPPGRLQLPLPGTGGTIDGSPYMFMLEGAADIDPILQPRLMALVPVQGPPAAAFRSTAPAEVPPGEQCSLTSEVVTETGAIISFITGDEVVSEERFYRVSTDPSDPPRLVGTLIPRGLDSAVAVRGSREALVATRAPGSLVTFDGTGEEVVIAAPNDERTVLPVSPMVVGPHIYWIQAEDFRGSLWRVRGADLETKERIDVFPGESIAFFWSDGDWALWMLATDRETGTVAFYAGQYAVDPARWEPRLLVETSNIRSARAGQHTLVTVQRTEPTSFHAYRFDERTAAELTVTDSMAPVFGGTPIYVTDDEFAYLGDGTAFRIDLSRRRFVALP